MAAHSWLSETPWPTQQLERAELESRIVHFLATHWMGVLCSIGKSGPIGTPVEYHAEDMTLYVLPQPNSPKVKAMQNDPRICFAIYGENSGWASVQGAQLFAKADFIQPGTEEHAHAMTIYRWQASSVQLGRALDQAPQVPLLRINAERIVYTQQWLRKDGYAPRQIWHRDPARQGSTRQYGH